MEADLEKAVTGKGYDSLRDGKLSRESRVMASPHDDSFMDSNLQPDLWR